MGAAAVRVLIDCDPGVDDALALMTALGAPEIEVAAVTTVAGNAPLAQTTANAQAILALAGRQDVPVVKGCAAPLAGEAPRHASVHGPDGLAALARPRDVAPPAPGHAVDAIVEAVREAPTGSLTLVAIGPLTNVAAALARAPDTARRLRRLVVMGGALTVPGNVSPVAEFNFHFDPAAARLVLSSGAPLTLFPLDVTRRAVATRAWIDALAAAPGRCSRAAAAMVRRYAEGDTALHDPCVIAMLIEPSLVRTRDVVVEVDDGSGPDRGRCLVRPAPSASPGAVETVSEIDAAGLRALLAERIGRLP